MSHITRINFYQSEKGKNNMSHIIRLKTKFKLKEFLLQALRELHYSYEEGNLEIYASNGTKAIVEIKVKTESRGYDIGFKRNGEFYDVMADWFLITDISRETFMQQLSQRYAYLMVHKLLDEQGFSFINEDWNLDKTIHLTVRRAI